MAKTKRTASKCGSRASRPSKKQIQAQLVANMRAWQKVEDAATASTGRVMEKTDNPIVRLAMEIIQRDSQMHYAVQGWIADTLEGKKAVTFTPDELAQVWSLIEKHIKLEGKTIELAQQSLDLIGNAKGMQLQAYLLQYLLEDEQKHNHLLERLRAIQSGMYPYG